MDKNIFKEASASIPKQSKEMVKGGCDDLSTGGSELASFKKAALYGLNDTLESFCRSVVRKRDIAGAYLRCIDNKISSDEAYKRGVSLLNREDVGHRVTELESDRRIVRNINKETVIARMARHTKVNACDYFDDMGVGGAFAIKPMSEWTDDMKEACSGIEPTKTGWKLSLYDKDVIWDKIAKLQGYYEGESKNLGAPNDLAGKTDEELRSILDVDYEEVKDGK